MKIFPYGHATHPDWEMAAKLVLAQLRAQLQNPDYASNPTLGLLYTTDHFAEHAQDLLSYLSAELPEVTDWSGTVGVGIASNNVEYFDEPALALMLCELPTDQYRVFSGVAPLGMGFEAHTALVHADPEASDLTDLIQELAQRTDSGQVFGGLTASRKRAVQFAVSGDGTIKGQGGSSGVFDGGLSGVAFGPGVGLLSRVTQGCLPLDKAHVITEAQHNMVITLGEQPALEVLLKTLQVSLDQPQKALTAVRATLVGLPAESEDDRPAQGRGLIDLTGHLVDDVRVRHIIGLDPARGGVVLAAPVQAGMKMVFCQRNVQAAKVDLVRICAEIREELEPEEQSLELATTLAANEAQRSAHPGRGIAGAIYISCAGRGGPHFGSDSAELQIIRKALGDVPLVGFFASGEIAHHQVYGYTGVLTVFTGHSS